MRAVDSVDEGRHFKIRRYCRISLRSKGTGEGDQTSSSSSLSSSSSPSSSASCNQMMKREAVALRFSKVSMSIIENSAENSFLVRSADHSKKTSSSTSSSSNSCFSTTGKYFTSCGYFRPQNHSNAEIRCLCWIAVGAKAAKTLLYFTICPAEITSSEKTAPR